MQNYSQDIEKMKTFEMHKYILYFYVLDRSSKTDTNKIIDGSKTSVYELITEDNVKVFTLITF